ncbi:MAG: hypothetical protein QW493_05770 [Candidatus Bathyarchaeia archaeon]
MKVIEVYIKTGERLQPPGGSYKDYDAHPCWQIHNIKKTIPSDVERILRALEAAAHRRA